MTGPALNRNDEDDLVVRQTALEIENEYLKAEIKELESSLSAKDEEFKESGKKLLTKKSNFVITSVKAIHVS